MSISAGTYLGPRSRNRAILPIRTMREVASIMGITYGGVFMLEQSAFRKLRKAFREIDAREKIFI